MAEIQNRWGRPGFEKEIGAIRHTRNLAQATGALSLGTRKLIYAFIKRGGVFKRGTWNGCVMNAASGTENVSTVSAAAEFFHEPYEVISAFIGEWDSTPGGDRDANRQLERILLECGVTNESPVWTSEKEKDSERVKVYRVRLFTSAETAAVEELRAEIDAGAFDADLASFRELVGV
jgi:hypothetical protein